MTKIFEAAQKYWLEIKSEIQIFDLAIIIPAYNEERRIGKTLASLAEYFNRYQLNYQVIVVNDGSHDNTSQVVKTHANNIKNLEVIELNPNVGKGWAVRSGVLASRANFVLFCDADGSTPFAEFEKLHQAILAGNQIAIGSRAVPDSSVSLETTLLRKSLGRTFNLLVNIFLLPKYFDTQCGFKLFDAEAAHKLFFLLTRKGFSFDLELLFLAYQLKLPVKEVAVNWQNVAGSKVNILVDSSKMFLDIFKIRFYWLKEMNKF